MQITLTEDWARVLRHAWSVRWFAIAFLCSLGEAGVQLVDDHHSVAVKLTLAAVASLASIAGLASRVLAQKHLTDALDDRVAGDAK